MGEPSSPNPIPHSVFTDLLNHLNAISPKTCNHPTVVQNGNGLDCNECTYNIKLDKLRRDISYIICSLNKQSSFEQELAEFEEVLLRIRAELLETILNKLTTAVRKPMFQRSISCHQFHNPLLPLQEGASHPGTEASTPSPILKAALSENCLNSRRVSSVEDSLQQHLDKFVEGLLSRRLVLPQPILEGLTTAVLKLKFQMPSTSCSQFQNPLLPLQQGASHPVTEASTSTPILEAALSGNWLNSSRVSSVEDQNFNNNPQRSLQQELDKFVNDLVERRSVHQQTILEGLTTAVLKLKIQMPSTLLLLQQGASHTDTKPRTPKPIVDQDLKARYQGLTPEERKCLWCISVFDGQVKKRVLINWWIGLELLPVSTGGQPVSSSEVAGEDMLQRLKGAGFIQQVVSEKPQADRWKIKPAARSVLMPEGMLDREVLLLKSGNLIDDLVNHDVKTVFNLNKSSIGDAEAERLAPMENLRVVHLGRSQMTEPKRIIRVQNLKLIMKRLYKKKELRLLSLQGIPSIRELPPSSRPPASLRVLDLSDCMALESLPWWTWGLKSLTHLDVSGCFILGSTPKEISLLDKLEVLKGVVVGPRYGRRNACTLQDLRKLVKLHKLSICVSTNNFTQEEDLQHLASIKRLVKLKIQWIPTSMQGPDSADDQILNSSTAQRCFTCCFRNQTRQTEAETNTYGFERLEKLDLWWAPNAAATVLLAPQKFRILKKLYIREAQFEGAQFKGAQFDEIWRVKTLRLLFLPHLEMTWEDREASFPRLSYLETQGCPNLSDVSQHCDSKGVWEGTPLR